MERSRGSGQTILDVEETHTIGAETVRTVQWYSRGRLAAGTDNKGEADDSW